MTMFTRREMFRLAMALPIAGVFTRFNPLVAAQRNKLKITDIKAMQINRIARQLPADYFPTAFQRSALV